MKTMFKSHGLWNLVKNGAPDPDLNSQENQRKDERVLFFNQQSMHDTIFSKIVGATTAKEAWTILKTLFKIAYELWPSNCKAFVEILRRCACKQMDRYRFFCQDSRITFIVNQIRTCEENVSEKTVVAKVLRSLTPKFNHVVTAIEESKNLSTYFFDELMGSL